MYATSGNIVFRLKTIETCFLCLVTLTCDPDINEFSGLIVEHLHVKFGDPSCIVF